ncbi:MAG: class I SAM-dependent methyltransferase [Gammaproteobacteria bacterium]|nr:class I SAM-dependent methyltransferase [Gammaproteobacteria bacterium]
MSMIIDWAERGLIPDPLLRLGMRRLMAARLASESLDSVEAQHQQFQDRLADLREGPLALHTDAANEQHYEVPAEFFRRVLGRHLKYSCCLWRSGVQSLDEAEAAMLALSCERAGLSDGQDVLELGCGWGSVSLWMAGQYPNSRITAVSNSAGQREFIEAQARERGLNNLQIITADMNDFAIDQQFDRVVSVEMFEHMRNYRELLRRIRGWLRPGGQLFVHIFCHREYLYPFETQGEYDWMAQHFFTGGVMPAESMLAYFQEDLSLLRQWRVDGRHYERTSNAWLARLDASRAELLQLFAEVYGEAEAARWLQRWRMFFLAVAELFGYAGGREWFVAHYLFQRRELG